MVGYYLVVYDPNLDAYRPKGTHLKCEYPNPVDRILLGIVRRISEKMCGKLKARLFPLSAVQNGSLETALIKVRGAASHQTSQCQRQTDISSIDCQNILRYPAHHWPRHFDQWLRRLHLQPIAISLAYRHLYGLVGDSHSRLSALHSTKLSHQSSITSMVAIWWYDYHPHYAHRRHKPHASVHTD